MEGRPRHDRDGKPEKRMGTLHEARRTSMRSSREVKEEKARGRRKTLARSPDHPSSVTPMVTWRSKEGRKSVITRVEIEM